MFSGIVETTVSLLEKTPGEHEFSIQLERPKGFTDIKRGDSIAVNGVCLTVEEFDQQKIKFTLGRETNKIISQAQKHFWSRPLNVERSLQVGDRMHGHFVQGHVDTTTEVLSVDNSSDSWIIHFRIPKDFTAYVWKKGSIALNGVSLTVNDVTENSFEVCLIPETLSRTNLRMLEPGDQVTFEVDFFARGVMQALKNMKGPAWS